MPNDPTEVTEAKALDVLFIDDSPNLCRAMGLWLKSSGYAAVTAMTAAEAEEIALRDRPRLIITDIGLPDCSGFDLRNRIAGAPGMEGTRFIALSGKREKSGPRNAIEAGFDTYIAKPPNFEELSAILRKYVPDSDQNTDQV